MQCNKSVENLLVEAYYDVFFIYIYIYKRILMYVYKDGTLFSYFNMTTSRMRFTFCMDVYVCAYMC